MTAYSNTIYYYNNNYNYNYYDDYYYYNNDYNNHARLIRSHWNLVSLTGIGGGVSAIPSVPAKSDTIYYNNYNNNYDYYMTTTLQSDSLVSTGVHPCPVGLTGIGGGVSLPLIFCWCLPIPNPSPYNIGFGARATSENTN